VAGFGVETDIVRVINWPRPSGRGFNLKETKIAKAKQRDLATLKKLSETTKKSEQLSPAELRYLFAKMVKLEETCNESLTVLYKVVSESTFAQLDDMRAEANQVIGAIIKAKEIK